MSKVFDLWKEVGGAFGPSGREDAVRETIAGIAGAYIDDITTDALGNLICRKKGAGKKVLFAAHMDSIGVVATYIDENGFIRFSQVGGLYYADLVNITVRFANGTRGVISFEEKTPMKDMTLAHMFIDIGAKNAEEAKKLVQIGDFAVFEAPRFEQNGVLCGPYLDNRIGCVTLLLMMEQLADSVERAQAKGATNILAMDSTRAFIINVPNARVITAITQDEMKENIFTNIDGAVFLQK